MKVQWFRGLELHRHVASIFFFALSRYLERSGPARVLPEALVLVLGTVSIFPGHAPIPSFISRVLLQPVFFTRPCTFFFLMIVGSTLILV